MSVERKVVPTVNPPSTIRGGANVLDVQVQCFPDVFKAWAVPSVNALSCQSHDILVKQAPSILSS